MLKFEKIYSNTHLSFRYMLSQMVLRQVLTTIIKNFPYFKDEKLKENIIKKERVK